MAYSILNGIIIVILLCNECASEISQTNVVGGNRWKYLEKHYLNTNISGKHKMFLQNNESSVDHEMYSNYNARQRYNRRRLARQLRENDNQVKSYLSNQRRLILKQTVSSNYDNFLNEKKRRQKIENNSIESIFDTDFPKLNLRNEMNDSKSQLAELLDTGEEIPNEDRAFAFVIGGVMPDLKMSNYFNKEISVSVAKNRTIISNLQIIII